MKKIRTGIIFFAVVFLIGITINLVVRHVLTTKHVEEIISSGYYPLEEVMKCDNFHKKENKYKFEKQIGEIKELIIFDFKKKKCKKNEYKFSLESSFLLFENQYYISKEKLEEILNCRIEYSNGNCNIDSLPYKNWYETTEMIAHAGGAVREGEFNSLYTNSKEALVENYNRGCRVFEFDFCFTSDNYLAAVHDWDDFGKKNGEPMSSKEWKDFQTFSKPMTDGRYTTMMLQDVLDEMMINKDMFLVTDSKSFELSEEEIVLQFKMIYEECMKRDEKLVDRIIVQIYNEEMYDLIMKIYNWKSIIFTVYETDAAPSTIIDFAAQHEAIKVITAPKSDERFGKNIIKKIHKENLLIYMHTTDSYNTLVDLKKLNVDGVYTNLLY